jgi:hypothetical protein
MRCSLIGVMPGEQTQHPPTAKLNLMSLDPSSGKFDPVRDLLMDAAGGPPGTVWILDGNVGEVHSFDAATGTFYVLLSSRPLSSSVKTVATIDWEAGAILVNPAIQFAAANPFRTINQMMWATEKQD